MCIYAQSCSAFCDLWTVAHQAALSVGLSRQEYWSELQFPTPEDLPTPGIKSVSPALQADSLSAEPQGKLKITEVVCHSVLQWTLFCQNSLP